MSNPNELVDPGAAAAAAQERPPETRALGVRSDIRHGFRLIAKYFKADPWVGGALMAVQIGFGAAVQYMMLFMTMQVAEATNALVARNGAVIPEIMGRIMLAFAAFLSVGIFVNWAKYTLRIRSRTVLTDDLVTRWLGGNSFYHIERRFQLDHPEQRIQDDLYQFIEMALELGPRLVGAVFPLFLYSNQLWKRSPPLSLDAIGINHTVDGYLVYVAVGFAVLWTVVTHFIGRGLTRAEVVRQRLEAQFRQEMGSIRENGEAIAFEKGGPIEQRRLAGTFGLIRLNWRFYTWSQIRVAFAASLPGVLFTALPTLLCAPFVLKGEMKVGDVQLVQVSLLSVYSSAGILVSSYQELAVLRSTVARLRLFHDLLNEDMRGGISVSEVATPDLNVEQLRICFPDGNFMVEVGDLRLSAGERLLIRGPSGAGKSTLLRSLAGLWPYGGGKILLPVDAKIAFLPQRPYIPDGTLASLMAYPLPAETHDDGAYAAILERLGLKALVPKLHQYAAWNRILSPGEQQRIAGARAILAAPDFLFVDEATSALDPRTEATLYQLMIESLPNAAIISVAHRQSVEAFHARVLEMSDRKASLKAAAPA